MTLVLGACPAPYPDVTGTLSAAWAPSGSYQHTNSAPPSIPGGPLTYLRRRAGWMEGLDPVPPLLLGAGPLRRQGIRPVALSLFHKPVAN